MTSIQSRPRAAALTFLVGAIAFGCSPDSARNIEGKGKAGTIVISASADADALLPPLILSVQGKQIADQIFDNLADIGDGLNTIGDAGFTPRLATSWSWAPDSSWIDFSINPMARWHDGEPVRANDVAFTFHLVKDTALASPIATNLDDVDSVSEADSLTDRVWLHKHPPDEFFKLATQVAILPAHLLKNVKPADLRSSPLASKPVGSGRFKFDRWDRGARVVLVADTGNYRGQPSVDRVIWTISSDYTGAALRFVSGAADFLDVVKPDFVARISGSGARVVITVPSLDYGYIGFNLRTADGKAPHPIFSNRAVRRALVMAVDRSAIVRSVFDSLAVASHGPFTRAIPTSDTTVGIPYDTAAAAKTLDSLGWRRGPSGIRARNGVPLAFPVIVPSSSTIRMRVAVLLQAQWRLLGVDMRIDPMETNSFGASLESKKFDAILNAWHLDPDPASFRDEWSSSQMKPGGFDVSSYSNPAFDATADSAAREPDRVKAIQLYHRAYHILDDDAPAMWIYELKNAFGVSNRIQPAGLRPDAWWSRLAEWTIKN
jgi:peptide/nickel transport system substrate-binding protein